MKLQAGTKTTSGNFMLVRRIETIEQFDRLTATNKSVFWRHRMYPSAFMRNLSFNVIKKSMKYGLIWTAIKTQKGLKDV